MKTAEARHLSRVAALGCALCGGEIKNSFPSRPKKYCGRECYHAAQRNNGRIVGETKLCSKCGTHKPFSEFPRQPSSRGGLHSYCKVCSSEYFHEMRGTPVDKRKPYAPAIKLTEEEKKARIKARSKVWRKKKAATILEWNKLRAHRQRAAGPTPHRFEIQALVCEQDGRCTYCGVLLEKYHIDHKTPVSRGGTNDLSNLQLLCPTCNLKKQRRTHEEYLAVLGRYVSQQEAA